MTLCRETPEITEKDWHCVANHINELVKNHWQHGDKHINACEACRKIEECMGGGKLLDCWRTFKKITEITGVDIMLRK